MTDIKELRKKIREYERKYTITENSSEVDKQKVLGYTESLSMICAAIREGRFAMDDK